MGPRKSGPKRLNWLRLRSAFVVRGLSLQQIAAEFDVNPSTVKRRCAAEGWVAERARIASDAGGVVRDAMVDAVREQVAVHAQRVDRALGLADRLLDRLDVAISLLVPSDVKGVRTMAEAVARHADALAKDIVSDRVVRGIPDGKPSDGDGTGDARFPARIELIVRDRGLRAATGTDDADPYGPE